jgi:aldehyde dehydrogenase (NAD+)
VKQYAMYVDGEWVPAESGETFESVNPWTQEAFASVPAGDAADVDRAVAAALRAFRESSWTSSAHARAKVLRRFAELLDENAESLAQLESADNGKIIREERGMFSSVGNYFRYAASLAETVTDTVPHGLNPSVLALTRRVPFGVIGIQTPWNTPGVILAQSASSALAAGNCIVVKPSEVAPCSTLAIAELAHQAGFPPGVFNVVTGLGATVGASLSSHRDVSKVVFTGGPEGGRHVAHAAAEKLAPVVMELGGKSANVVFADADVDAAAMAVAQGFTAAGGQSCMAGGRAIIEASIYDRVLEKVLDYVGGLKFGDPSDETTDVGPAATAAQIERIETFVAKGQAEGAKMVYGGARPESVDHPLFYLPTVFTEAESQMAICQEEIFGPVLALLKFETEAEALELANDTRYGLSLAVWTRDLDRAHRVSQGLRAGVVWVNQYRRGDPSFANGGIGESGYGRVSGMDGYLEMTYPQSIQIALG